MTIMELHQGQSLSAEEMKSLLSFLKTGNEETSKRFPGEREARQPVHTVYGGAHLFKWTTAKKIGEIALKQYQTYAPDAATLARALDLPEGDLREKVFARVTEKLTREAVEDFRIDFEDGFGHRPDAEEDAAAVQAARETAQGQAEGTLPPFIGVRIKPLSEELKERSIRTLDLYLTALLKASGGRLPEGFVVTLPKITHREQVKALVRLFEALEDKLELRPGTLQMEFMVETPQSILTPTGECALPGFLDEARGRCTGAHFGTYDYTASIDITAEYQRMDHPSCDFARHMMKVSFAGTGVFLSDGATNIMPVEVHKDPKNDREKRENAESVHRIWKINFDHIQHSLKHGYYQGWDLHPAQLPVRYAALYTFFQAGLPAASKRLKNFVEQATKATLVGDVFDDAATGQGLLNFFLRALNCGAITEEELRGTGLTLDEVRCRSFKKIMETRRKGRA